MADVLTFDDGFRVTFPVFVVLDTEKFKKQGLDGSAEMLEDAIVGAFVPIFTSRRSCQRTVRARELKGKLIVPLLTPVELWAELMILLQNGVQRIIFDPDEDGRSYPLRDVLDLIPPPPGK